jgi:hypothetical protein
VTDVHVIEMEPEEIAFSEGMEVVQHLSRPWAVPAVPHPGPPPRPAIWPPRQGSRPRR